jgi:hypothetical protein
MLKMLFICFLISLPMALIVIWYGKRMGLDKFTRDIMYSSIMITGVLIHPLLAFIAFLICMVLIGKKQRKQCPHCVKTIHKDATRCPYCQGEVHAAQ